MLISIKKHFYLIFYFFQIINLPIIKFRNYIKEQGLSEVEIERLRKLRRYVSVFGDYYKKKQYDYE
jgi:hypothetical protein